MTNRERREQVERAKAEAVTRKEKREAFALAYRWYLDSTNAAYPESYDYGLTRAEATRIRSAMHAADLRELAASPFRQDRKAAALGGYPF